MGSTLGVEKIAAHKVGLSLEEYRRRLASDLKHCTVCKVWKPKTMFGTETNRWDNLSPRCLECARARYIRRQRGPSPLRGKPLSDETRKKLSVAHKGKRNHRWKGGVSRKRVDPPEVTLAKRAVNHAVEAGRLAVVKTLPCIICGGKARHYHHHRGYGRTHWLDVQAVCTKCHREIHAKQ